MPRADFETNALFDQLPWAVTNSGRFRRSAHINLQEARALKNELRTMVLSAPERCRKGRRSVVGVDSRVLCGAGMKGRSSSYRLNGILRTLTSVLVSFRISIALPWVATKSNPADHPSRRAPLPAVPPLSPEIASILKRDVCAGRPLQRSDLRTLQSTHSEPTARPVCKVPRLLRGSGCDLPSLSEIERRVQLALGNKGRGMQRNVCSQQLQRLCSAPPGASLRDFERSGSFAELFAGRAGICMALRSKGDADCRAFEAYPESLDDSGLRAPRYDPECDLLRPMVLIALLVSIYGRLITRLHLGPPCVTWGLLFQNLGPGTRTANLWQGLCQDEREIRGNQTMGATLLILRAIWEMFGTATFEHPLTSRVWPLKAMRGLLGLPGFRRVRIDQCEYGLRPGDDAAKRYLKPTGILLCGDGPFEARRCKACHEHIQILGSYRGVRSDGKPCTIQRSHEAGSYPRSLCSCLAKFHR